MLLHDVRRKLLSALATDNRLTSVLAGDHERAVAELFQTQIDGKNDRILLSADLKNATDRIPLDLIQSLIKGLK